METKHITDLSFRFAQLVSEAFLPYDLDGFCWSNSDSTDRDVIIWVILLREKNGLSNLDFELLQQALFFQIATFTRIFASWMLLNLTTLLHKDSLTTALQ